MPIETERKWLIWQLPLLVSNRRMHIIQVYAERRGKAVRFRKVVEGTKVSYFRTVKTYLSKGSNLEDETEIDRVQFREGASRRFTKPLSKTRLHVPVDEYIFEVDFFLGSLVGLKLAELERPDALTLDIAPPWPCFEVTGDREFSNVELVHSNRSWSNLPHEVWLSMQSHSHVWDEDVNAYVGIEQPPFWFAPKCCYKLSIAKQKAEGELGKVIKAHSPNYWIFVGRQT